MQKIGRGGTATFLDAYYQDGTGSLVDPLTPLVDIIDVNSLEVVTNAVPTRLSLGHFTYPSPGYVVSASAPLGVWKAHWTGTINSVPVAQDDYFEVVAAGSIGFDDGWPTVADLEARLNRDLNAGEETQANAVLADVIAAVKGYTRQSIQLVSNDPVELKGTWERELDLPEKPVANVTAVSLRSPFVAVQTLASTAWWLRADGKLLTGSLGVPCYGWGGPDTIVAVTYSHGYATIPGDIRGVVLSAAQRTQSSSGVREVSVGPYKATFSSDDFTGAETTTLNRYRKRFA